MFRCHGSTLFLLCQYHVRKEKSWHKVDSSKQLRRCVAASLSDLILLSLADVLFGRDSRCSKIWPCVIWQVDPLVSPWTGCGVYSTNVSGDAKHRCGKMTRGCVVRREKDGHSRLWKEALIIYGQPLGFFCLFFFVWNYLAFHPSNLSFVILSVCRSIHQSGCHSATQRLHHLFEALSDQAHWTIWARPSRIKNQKGSRPRQQSLSPEQYDRKEGNLWAKLPRIWKNKTTNAPSLLPQWWLFYVLIAFNIMDPCCLLGGVFAPKNNIIFVSRCTAH